MELKDLKGIGPKRLALFSEMNIHTVEDLLRFYPREYLDYSQIVKIRDSKDGDRVSVCVTAQADPTVFYYKGKYIVSILLSTVSKESIKKTDMAYDPGHAIPAILHKSF